MPRPGTARAASKLPGVRQASLAQRLAPPIPTAEAVLTSPAATLPLVILAGALVGVMLVAKPLVIFGLLALVLAGLGLAVAFARPELAFGGLVAILALIPTYASPSVGPILFIPAAAAGWVIAVGLMWRNLALRGHLFKANYIDAAVGAFLLLMAISISFSARAELTDYVHNMFMWAGPYFGARVLIADVKHPVKVVATSFAAMVVVLAPIAVAESLGGSNPFYNLNFNSGEFGLWASQIDRFGSVRAVTSFGHPIAFSMFLAVSALLSIAMAISSSETKPRVVWYSLAAVSIGTMALALSRTGWVMVAVGVVILAAVTVRGAIRTRLITLLVIVVLVVLFTSMVLPHELQVLPGFGHASESNYQSSGLYREALLERALQPGVLGLWGNVHNMVTPAVQFGTATDNAYIILADAWGLIPTFALFSVAAGLLVAIGRAYGLPGEPLAILPIVAFTCMVAIFFVAFITQQQAMIWLLIGVAAGAEGHIAEQRRERQAQRRINGGLAWL